MNPEDLNYRFNVRMDLIIKEALLKNHASVIDWIAKNKTLNHLLIEFHQQKGFIDQTIFFGPHQILEAAKLGHVETLNILHKTCGNPKHTP
jgi:hypothetical protein